MEKKKTLLTSILYKIWCLLQNKTIKYINNISNYKFTVTFSLLSFVFFTSSISSNDFVPFLAFGQDQSNQRFVDRNLGLSLEYPSSWTQVPIQSGVAFTSPFLSTLNGPAALFQISVLENPNTSLREFGAQVVNNFKINANGFQLSLDPVFKDEIHPSYDFGYTYSDPNDISMKVYTKFIQNGDKIYQLMFVTPAAYFSSYSNDAITIGQSMQILGPIKIAGVDPETVLTQPTQPTQPPIGSGIGIDNEQIIDNIN